MKYELIVTWKFFNQQSRKIILSKLFNWPSIGHNNNSLYYPGNNLQSLYCSKVSDHSNLSLKGNNAAEDHNTQEQ